MALFAGRTRLRRGRAPSIERQPEEEKMHRKALLLSAVAASALIASNAWADVAVFGTVDKDVTITVDETLTKLKQVTFTVTITARPNKFAEASTHFNQRNEENTNCENCAEKTDLLQNSVGVIGNGNTGITSVNQAGGNNNNQANIISFAFDVPVGPPAPPPPPPPNGGSDNTGFAESQVAGEQIVTRTRIETRSITFRDALIQGSINDNSGITMVNQATGNTNNQANAISIAVSSAAGVALSDAALGQFVTQTSVIEIDVSKRALTSASIIGNSGITQVNQSAGVLGNQANVVSLAITGF
jgi:hypothetical protein